VSRVAKLKRKDLSGTELGIVKYAWKTEGCSDGLESNQVS
jgi:hypothetical protein